MTRLLATPTGRWVLLGSLALNVALLIALLLPRFGLGLGGEAPPEPRDRRSVPSPWVLHAALDDEGRALVRAIMQRHREPVRAAVRGMRAARRDAEAAVRAEPFDAAVLEQAFATLREREAAATAAVHGMLADAFAELGAEQRAAVADRLWRSGRRDDERRREWRERREARDGRDSPWRQRVDGGGSLGESTRAPRREPEGDDDGNDDGNELRSD